MPGKAPELLPGKLAHSFLNSTFFGCSFVTPCAVEEEGVERPPGFGFVKNRLDHRLRVASIFVSFQKNILLRLPLSTVNVDSTLEACSYGNDKVKVTRHDHAKVTHPG